MPGPGEAKQGCSGRRALLAGALMIPSILSPPATAQGVSRVVRLNESQFRPGAGRITFSEVPRGTRNPVYPPSLYGGTAQDPTVRFGGHLRGRRLSDFDSCPRGAALSGCLSGTPSAPLSIDEAAPPTIVVFDSSPSVQDVQLSGTPTFNGPIAILFSRDVAAVGLLGGYFNAVNGTAITVYDRRGRELGRTANRGIGREFLALASSDLSEVIAALEFHLVGPEPQGFGIDNIRFANLRQVDIPGVRPPEPPATPPAAPPPPPPLPSLLL
ncbi:PEP-CTERM sorting domain-containing protein [Roseomonas sp. F4]